MQLSVMQQQEQQRQMMQMHLHQQQFQQQPPTPPPKSSPPEPQVGTPWPSPLWTKSSQCCLPCCHQEHLHQTRCTSSAQMLHSRGASRLLLLPQEWPGKCAGVQASCSPFASPQAQRHAAQDELDSGSEDTAAHWQDGSPHILPTVDEECSQELPTEHPEDRKKQEGEHYS